MRKRAREGCATSSVYTRSAPRPAHEPSKELVSPTVEPASCWPGVSAVAVRQSSPVERSGVVVKPTSYSPAPVP